MNPILAYDALVKIIGNEKKSKGIHSTGDLLRHKADDYTRPEFAYLLADLQANILKPHGKQCAVLAFIEFKKNHKKEELKRWFAKLPLSSTFDQILEKADKEYGVSREAEDLKAIQTELSQLHNEGLTRSAKFSEGLNEINEEGGNITSNIEYDPVSWYNMLKAKKANSRDPVQTTPLASFFQNNKVISCIYLSHAGYMFLGGSLKLPFTGENTAFARGLNKGTGLGSENSPLHFDIDSNYTNTIHAMLLVAWDEDDLNPSLHVQMDKQLQHVMNLIEDSLDGIGKVFFETGFRNPQRSKKEAKEWFGFKDGISNPWFFPTNLRRAAASRDQLSYLNSVLRPCSGTKPNSCGSFLVFMKLQQHQNAFLKVCEDLAEKIFGTTNAITQAELDYAAALLIGRHKDGTPLTRSQTPIKQPMREFNYSDDTLGMKCPFHAHIRKANPREGDSNRRIVRRGMVYGREGDPDKGILFMSFQGDLEHQFEYIVNDWLFKYENKGNSVAEDPILGRGLTYSRYCTTWGKNDKTVSTFNTKPLATFKGGLYFFAPSISYINITIGEYL